MVAAFIAEETAGLSASGTAEKERDQDSKLFFSAPPSGDLLSHLLIVRAPMNSSMDQDGLVPS